MPGVERLLIGVDASPDGRLAARLAGYFVGARQITATVLELGQPRRAARSASSAEGPAALVQSAADRGGQQAQQTDATRADTAAAIAAAAATTAAATSALSTPAAVAEPAPAAELLLKVSNPSLSETAATAGGDSSKKPDHAVTVLAEAGKGYDMIFLGLAWPVETSETPVDADEEDEVYHGTLRRALEKVIRGFAGSTAVAVARGELLPPDPLAAGALNILVPTTGTDYSRRAAEVAVAIAKAAGGQVTALHVARPPDENDLLRHSPERRLRTGRALVALVGEVEALGQREGVPVTARVIIRRGQDDAIMDQVARGRHNLVVLGVKARPSGERLFFGHAATALIEQIPCALLLVTS
ncbi:MAG: universal stress protein [Verrucomicrobia bacterium]|nr:universal stress protein [Verrucomicrobiota bacterium]